MTRLHPFPAIRSPGSPYGLALVLALFGCDTSISNSVIYASAIPFRVGTKTRDDNLPPEPSLPTLDQVCATLEASNKLIKRPDGALPPGADPSPAGAAVAVDAAIVNLDQACIQAALDACGLAWDDEVGPAIAAAGAAAMAAQKATPGATLFGASAEELGKPQYHASKFAVRLAVSILVPETPSSVFPRHSQVFPRHSNPEGRRSRTSTTSISVTS